MLAWVRVSTVYKELQKGMVWHCAAVVLCYVAQICCLAMTGGCFAVCVNWAAQESCNILLVPLAGGLRRVAVNVSDAGYVYLSSGPAGLEAFTNCVIVRYTHYHAEGSLIMHLLSPAAQAAFQAAAEQQVAEAKVMQALAAVRVG